MKYYIYIFFFFSLWVGNAIGQSPSPCGSNVEIKPIGDCCAEIIVEFTLDCGTNTSPFNQIEILPIGAEIASITLRPSYNDLGSTIVNNGALGSISTSQNILRAANLGQADVIGEICFKNANAGSLTTESKIYHGNNELDETFFDEFTLNCPPITHWNKIYGDGDPNTPRRIRAFENAIYISSRSIQNGAQKAILSKFELATGNLLWEKILNVNGDIQDFVSDGNGHLIAIGNTPTINSGMVANNQSFILKINSASGNLVDHKVFDFPGREIFSRIIQHKHPLDPIFRYYILGTKNPSNLINTTTDEVILVNIDENLNLNWFNRYEHPQELEANRQLIGLSDGDVLILGNGDGSNPGIILEVNGNTGAVNKAKFYRHSDELDFRDGIEYTNYSGSAPPFMVISGTKLSSNTAVLIALDPSYNVAEAIELPELTGFLEIGQYSKPGGHIFTSSNENGNTPNRNIVSRFSFDPSSKKFAHIYSRYLTEINETAYSNAHIQVSPQHEAIFYADARKDNPNGLGDWDMMVGVYDLWLNGDNCDLGEMTPNDNPLMINVSDETVINEIIDEPIVEIPLELLGTGLVCQEFCNPILPIEPWDKICGDELENLPKKIKTFGDAVYIAGSKTIGGQPYATLSKLDINTGIHQWDAVMDKPSIIRDFVDGGDGNIIAIGRTPHPNSIDNQSILMKFDISTGVFGPHKIHNFDGRESLEVIIRHKSPIDPTFPFYILGRKNPSGSVAPSSFDVGFLMNIDANLNVKQIREHTLGSTELESSRGLVDLSDGSLLILGNGSGTINEGLLLHTDGNGMVGALQGVYYPDGIDLYDGIELGNGLALLSGTRYITSEALLLVIQTSGTNAYSIIGGKLFPNVESFEEVRVDRNGNIYTVGREKNSPNRNIVYKSTYDFLTKKINVGYKKYLDKGETAFSDPHIFVSPQRDNIFYTDARKDNPAGFGDFDLLIGAYDLDLTSTCAEDLSDNSVDYTFANMLFTPRSLQINEPIPTDFSASLMEYSCNDFCADTTVSICDFTFSVNCLDVALVGMTTTLPSTLEWDIDCNGTPDFTGPNPVWTAPASGTYNICMNVIDANGFVVCSIPKSVTVPPDNTPPFISCPPDITLFTDQSTTCSVPYTPVITAEDNCDPNVIITCQLTGATTGDETTTQFNVGVTTITCTATDADGNTSTCSYTVTVIDNTPPTITCPQDLLLPAQACDGGAIGVFSAQANDNCGPVEIEYSHPSESLFPCGTTTVTVTATDQAGNTATCTFNVYVDCQCATYSGVDITCNLDDPNKRDFTFYITSQTGLANPGQSCTINLTATQTGVTLSNISTTWNGPRAAVSGIATFGCPTPSELKVIATLDCVCPSGNPISCEIPLTVEALCCKTVEIPETTICRTAETASIPLIGCDDLCDVQQVRWYVADAPCPPNSWTLLQTSNSCEPLQIIPNRHNGNICVYAEIEVGSGDGTCGNESPLVTEPVTIILCDPVSCTISNSSQSFCYMGTAITPAPLTASLIPPTPNCPYTVQWYDEQDIAIPGATQLTYQPPNLSLPAGQDCYKDFVYTMKVTSECGVQACSATIRLYNDDAPVGLLEMDPVKPLPLCCPDDATLRYTPACAGDPEEWKWKISHDGQTYNYITTAGTQNPLYNTNLLYQDTWYRVEKQNGVCPVDTVGIFIPVNEPLTIRHFEAVASPVCDPNTVKLKVTWTPTAPPYLCSFIITWYRNGQVIHTSTSITGTDTYTYSPPSADEVEGNYYAVISSNCCPEVARSSVVQVPPPYKVFVAGPCFRCNNAPITLTGVVVDPIPGATCTYQWYDENGLIIGETGTTLQVSPSQTGPFTFETTCVINGTTCVKTDVFDLKQCGSNPVLGESFPISIDDLASYSIKVYPNPTSDQLILDFDQPAKENMKLVLTDNAGRIIRELSLNAGTTTHQLDISNEAEGAYFVRIIQNNVPIWVERVVKK